MTSTQTTLPGYGKVHAIGKPEVADLLHGNIVVQEKIDGSQFSFGIINGELQCRSKSVGIDLTDPPNQFGNAVRYVMSIAGFLKEGEIYRCEVLSKPRHNVLEYKRTPINGLMLFDVQLPGGRYADDTEVNRLANILGIEACPVLWEGHGDKFLRGMLDEFLRVESVLGGALIEGVVIKRRDATGPDGSVLKGKYVSEAFKETHHKVWREIRPTKGDAIDLLAEEYTNPMRWEKAVQHLRDAGTLTNSPQDIGPLIKEVRADVAEECHEEIKAKLWEWFWPKLQTRLAAGLPEWYKAKLADKQFEQGEDSDEKAV